jgi:thioredoxin 1
MDLKNVIVIDESNFEREVLESPTPFLLDFTATWCGPCRALKPTLERLASGADGAFRVGILDVDASPAIAQKLGIRGMPTVVAFAGGAERARHLGVGSAETLLRLLGRAS